MVDDWMAVGDTEEEALEHMRKISEVLERLGFTMQIEKAEVGQRIVFLGILIDSVVGSGCRCRLTQYKLKVGYNWYPSGFLEKRTS